MARYGFTALFAVLLNGLFGTAPATAAEPPKPTLAAQQTACTKGDGRACFDIADRLERGTGVAKDPVRALTFHIRACELKQGEACYRAGTLLDSASSAPDLPRATQFYRKGCDLKSANGCFSLGFAYRLGKGVATNQALGTSLMDKGCTMGSSGCKFLRDKGLLPPRAAAPAPARAAPPPAGRTAPAAAKNPMSDPETSCRTNPDKEAAASSCETIGYTMEMDMGDGGNPGAALWYHDRACTLGNASGCTAAGMLYWLGRVGATGNPPKPDLVKAFGYNRRACDLDPGECWYVANNYWKGEGVTLNLVTAEALYRRSCKASPDYGCSSTAYFLDKTKRGQPGEIVALYEKACTSLNASSCKDAAEFYQGGKGITPNPAKAASLRQAACKLDKTLCPKQAAAPARPASPPAARAAPAKNPMDDPDTSCRTNPDKKAAALACNDLGVVMEMDMGDITGQPEFKRALWYFDRACALGRAGGCNSAGIMYSEGKIGARGNPPQADHVTAFGYFRRACELEPKGCWEVAGAFEDGLGVAKSLATAEQFYRQSCRADPEFACWLTGNFLDRTKRGKPGEVVALYEGACKQSYPKACRDAALIYENGKGVAKDRGKAESLRQLACIMTGETSCPPLDPAPAVAQAVAPQPSPAPPAVEPARKAVPATAQAKRSAREPVVPGSALARGIALYREKDFQPALALFLAAAKQDPGDPRAYAYLAGTYDWLGMSVESRMAADTARRIDPDALAIVQFAFGGP